MTSEITPPPHAMHGIYSLIFRMLNSGNIKWIGFTNVNLKKLREKYLYVITKKNVTGVGILAPPIRGGSLHVHWSKKFAAARFDWPGIFESLLRRSNYRYTMII